MSEALILAGLVIAAFGVAVSMAALALWGGIPAWSGWIVVVGLALTMAAGFTGVS